MSKKHFDIYFALVDFQTIEYLLMAKFVHMFPKHLQFDEHKYMAKTVTTDGPMNN